MARKATEQVTTIGTDIGKNGLHLIGLDSRFGSEGDHRRPRQNRPLPRGKQPSYVCFLG